LPCLHSGAIFNFIEATFLSNKSGPVRRGSYKSNFEKLQEINYSIDEQVNACILLFHFADKTAT
jgi:hypothetical protein